MAAKDIEAGRAHVLLRIRNQMSQGLANASKQLKNFGAGLATAGGILSGAGIGVLSTLGGIAKSFASTTGEIGDMANRTGMAREYLSQLAFAAKLTGTDLGTVEKGMQRLSDVLGSAAMGNKGASESLGQLGFRVKDLMAMSPENRFESIGKAVASIKDPALRTSKAMDLFGKSGAGLLDMFSDIESLKSQADQLGITITDSDIRMGEELGDSYDSVTMALKGLSMQVGAAVAGPIGRLLKEASRVIASATEWISKNRSLVISVASIAASVVAAGGALIVFGGMASIAGFAISGLGATFNFLAAAIGVIFSPLGMTIGLIFGSAAAILYFRNEIEVAVGVISAYIQRLVPLASTIVEAVADVFGGWSKAILSGDFELAVEILFAKIELIVVSSINRIKGLFIKAAREFTEILTGELKLDGFAGKFLEAHAKIYGALGGPKLSAQDAASMMAPGISREAELQGKINSLNSKANETFDNPVPKIADLITGASSTGASALTGFGDELRDKFDQIMGDMRDQFKAFSSGSSGGGSGLNFPVPTMLTGAETKLTSRGTFSAAGAALMASGSDFQQQTAKNTAILVDQNRQMMKQGGNRFR